MYNWLTNKKELIKKIEIIIVRNGFARHYILNVGIQSLQEDLKTLEFLVVLRHDNKEISLFHTVKMFTKGIVGDFKIDFTKISIENISRETAINLGLSTLGLGAGIIGVMSTGGVSV